MVMLTNIPGLEIPVITLLLLGLSIGVLSGFTGVGGGFFVTPALIVMGLPVTLAVGTSLFWVFFNSLAGFIIHRNQGNSDIKMGIYIALSSLIGVEVGIQLAFYMHTLGVQDVAILSVSIGLMTFIGAYTIIESLKRKDYLDQIGAERHLVSYLPTASANKLRAIQLPPLVHFNRSGVTVSLWIILILGFLIGVSTGFIGTGGGFIIVPALVYLMGIPAVLAVGTSTMPVILSSLYGGGRYLLSGNVVIPVALVILSTSIPGVIYGASVTKYVRGVTIRMVLGMTILIVSAGAILKLGWFVFDKALPLLQSLANIVTIGGMLFSMGSVVLLKSISKRYRMGKRIPLWSESLFQQHL
jgi:uncharacterized membrane protein YfcA